MFRYLSNTREGPSETIVRGMKDLVNTLNFVSTIFSIFYFTIVLKEYL